MDGVVERAAFDVDVGGLFEERDEPRGCPRHPRLGKPLVVERRDKELEDVPSGTEAGKDIGGGAGTLEEVDREAAVGLLVAAGDFDARLDPRLRFGPAAAFLSRDFCTPRAIAITPVRASSSMPYGVSRSMNDSSFSSVPDNSTISESGDTSTT